MSKKRARERWNAPQGAAVVAAWRASGLSKSAFAAREGFPASKLARWIEKEIEAKPKSQRQPMPRFVPVQVIRSKMPAAASREDHAEIRASLRLPDGTEIRLEGGEPSELCRAMLRAIRAESTSC